MLTSTRVDLYCRRTTIRQVLFIPHTGLVAVTSNEYGCVYANSTDGKVIFAFEKHSYSIIRLLCLDAQIVASLDAEDTIFTWKASCGTVIDTITLPMEGRVCSRFEKLNSATMAVSFEDGPPLIVAHRSGRNLRVSKHFVQQLGHLNPLFCAINDNEFAVATMRSIQVCNNEEKLMASLLHGDVVTYIIANERFLIVACPGGKIHVRSNVDNYPVIGTLNVNAFHQNDEANDSFVGELSFVRGDLFMATSYGRGIYFVALPTMELVSCIRRDHIGLRVGSAIPLGDSHICIVRGSAYSIFHFPEPVRSYLRENLYQSHQASIAEDRVQATNARRRNETDTAPPESSPADEVLSTSGESSSAHEASVTSGESSSASCQLSPSSGTSPESEPMSEVVNKRRRSETEEGIGAVDSTSVKSKKRVRVSSQALLSDAEDIHALLVKQNGIIDAAKSKLENENESFIRVTIELEEEKTQLRKLNETGDKQDGELKKLGRKLKKLKKLKTELKKQLELLGDEGSGGEEVNDAVMNRMKREICELKGVVQRLLFQFNAEG